jgi:hypothetical protein
MKDNPDHCYFHGARAKRRLMRWDEETFSLPDLEDRPSIQLALNELIAAVLAGRVTEQKARLVSRIIQHAMQNLREPEFAQRFLPYGSLDSAITEAEPGRDFQPVVKGD